MSDIAGVRFGKLLAVRPSHRDDSRRSYWECSCDCGGTKVVRRDSLVRKDTDNCGCSYREFLETRGHPGHPLYWIWKHMLRRCRDPKDPAWGYYGGRGIAVCERWLVFKNFVADMGQRPSPLHSIDRKNTNGNYEPENCYWATWDQQNQNSRGCVLNPEMVARIRILRAARVSVKAIATEIGVNYESVRRVIIGRTWKGIGETETRDDIG